MKISVKVKPQGRQDKVERIGLDSYTVWVKAKAQEGRANQAVVRVLAEYFDIAKSKITLVKGARSKEKIFIIDR
jgi:uncharacterized protein YggU (UPF0235/DUF167 family)